MDHDSFKRAYSYMTGRQGSAEPDEDLYEAWIEHLGQCRPCSDWYCNEEVTQRGLSLSGFPCVHMAYYASNLCEQHDDPWDCSSVLVVATDQGWGLPLRGETGEQDFVKIDHCPWCGTELGMPDVDKLGEPEKLS